MEVIYILWLRQLKRYRRSRSRMLGALGQPLLFLIAMGFGFGPIFARAGGGSYVQFLSPGVMAMAILFAAVTSGMEVLWDRQFGFLKETMVAPVARFQVMLGRTCGGATVAALQGVVVLVAAIAVGFRPLHAAQVPLALLVMVETALLFTAFGTIVAWVVEDMQGFQLVMNFLVMPLVFVSGMMFPIVGLPKWLMLAALVDPLTYGVDAIRGSLTGVTQFGLLLDVTVLGGCVAILLGLGSYLFSRTRA